jgi:hypothetical protein
MSTANGTMASLQKMLGSLNQSPMAAKTGGRRRRRRGTRKHRRGRGKKSRRMWPF